VLAAVAKTQPGITRFALPGWLYSTPGQGKAIIYRLKYHCTSQANGNKNKHATHKAHGQQGILKFGKLRRGNTMLFGISQTGDLEKHASRC
jgi:hypothetical protein